jgi:hypothetical protein
MAPVRKCRLQQPVSRNLLPTLQTQTTSSASSTRTLAVSAQAKTVSPRSFEVQRAFQISLANPHQTFQARLLLAVWASVLKQNVVAMSKKI